MQKSFLLPVLSVLALFSSFAGAEYPGRYVRKQLKPNFFIPAEELDHTEKLPEFNYYPEEERKAARYGKTAEKEQIIKVIRAPKETQNAEAVQTETKAPSTETAAAEIPQVPVNDMPAPLPENIPSAADMTEIKSAYIEYDKDELAQIPEYKQKYDDYINDLKIIAETGQIPENPRVVFDLTKMSTNERLVVTDKFGLQPVEATPDVGQ